MRWPYTPDDHEAIGRTIGFSGLEVAEILESADNVHGDWDRLTTTQAGRKIIKRLTEFVRNP